MPLRDYESKHNVDLGSSSSSSARRLADEGGEADYDMISFSGYSLKFAKCQPVQYFSERALDRGEHSPMITSDIVVLRLCPTSSCSESTEYGCNYNFSEYAMELADYVQIMLEYAALKRDYMCDYCNNCLAYGNNNGGNNNGRRLQDEGNNDGDNQGDENDGNQDNEQQQGDYNNEQENDQNNNYNANNEGNNNNNYDADEAAMYACGGWSTYCGEYGDYCVNQNGGEDNENGGNYMAFEDYEEYLYCAQVDINDYAYFVKPRCDGNQGTIKMGIYYDNYCNQYAGNEVNLKNAGLGFREGVFQDFYSSTCLDCSESDYPPYDAASVMCNELHYGSAKCTEDMSYDLFGDESDDSTECSYIESIRFGTYNAYGQLTGGSSDGSTAEQITDTQKYVLIGAMALSVFFIVYACYLHHAMTNLLIKSLSHRELLPPSRHQNYRSRSGRRSRKVKRVDDEPDWDEGNNGEYA